MPRHNGCAVLSDCGKYRYELGGDIGPVEPLLTDARVVKMILWIMLNPSKADAMVNDQTIRTIVGFSEIWGYNRLLVGNLYAYRETKSKLLWKARQNGVDIVGPQNDFVIPQLVERVRSTGGVVMAAWGAGAEPERVREVMALTGPLMCLRTNKDGSPVHPLYQPHDLKPRPWPGVAA